MTDDFAEKMSQKTDEALISIVTVDRDGYQPAAVLAAEAEIKKRGIDSSKVEEVKIAITTTLDEFHKLEHRKATSWARLLHYVIDRLAYILLAFILSIVADLFFNIYSYPDLAPFLFILYVVSFLGYYIYMEHTYQKTLGKFITKTLVVKKNGQRAQLGDIVGRTFCRLIPLDNLSYLFTRNGFHDYLSETIVIRDKEAT